jgi:phosphoglycerol transferase MdoB-like AlkP superfamily enzyme
MFKSLLFLVRYYLFWLLFFFADRLLFLILYHQKLVAVPFTEISATFYHALKLDLSMASYLVVIPLLSYIFWLLSGRKHVELKWLPYYIMVLVILFSSFSAINFNTFREWGIKVNAQAIGFLIKSPKEALASSASSPVALSVSLIALLSVVGFFLQRYIVTTKLVFKASPVAVRLVASIVLAGLTFLLIRGGLGGSPINQSMAYFSKEQILNQAAVNTEWNLLAGAFDKRATRGNPYVYLDPKVAAKAIKEMYTPAKDTTLQILNTKRPNVVLVIIESFTADLTKTLGDEDGITPHFDSLMHKGVLFSRIYSPGSRTDKGIVASLAAFPTLAAGSLVKWPEKMQKIPAISQSLYKNGYHTSFFYGGESEFDNYKAFILSHNYQKLIDKNSFTGDDMKSRWGKYDEVVFARQISDLKQEPQPFFSTLLTLTNHEPYDLPGTSKFGMADNVTKFKSTAYYTDSCINAYLNNAKKEAWYKNTLFVFVADHGHLLPKNKYDISEPQRYHIPLLFYGDVIKDEYKGKKFDHLGSQTDIAATLLTQLGISATEFPWSKNLLNPYTKPFAFFSWDNGMGYIDDKQCVTFDNVGKQILYNSDDKNQQQTNKTLNNAKAYLQSVYHQFIEL